MKRLTTILITLLAAAAVSADPATQPSTQPSIVTGYTIQATTQPVGLAPTTQADITASFFKLLKDDPGAGKIFDTSPATQPSVMALLSQMNTAYADLKSAQFNGHITGNFDVQGEQSKYDVPFTSSFSGLNQFRHEVSGDILLGSTGTSVYAFLGERNEYQSFDAPKAHAASADWPAPVVKILVDQNPSLLLAMCKSVSVELNEFSKKITLEPPTMIDAVSYDTLRFDVGDDHEIVTMLVDPGTHFLKRVEFDRQKPMEKVGATEVKSALVTVDYTSYTTNGALPADQFAWAPPAGAVQTSSAVTMADAGDGLSDEQKAMIGKPAADFTLKGLDDNSVTLSAQKGSVVVLDFWATSCGPCVASLPHLDSLYREQGPNGLKVFALDQKELKAQVGTFVTKKGWTIPILLDSDASVGEAYKVNGIPQTVVIGKDGIVKQVYIGSGHEKEIAAAVAAQMQ